MFKIAFATITTAAIMLAVSHAPASARICKRICQDGVCWSDCSKLPGQTNVSVQGASQSLGARRVTGKR